MPKAVWNGAVLAESNETIVVERNHYFPPEAINREYLVESPATSTCPWKGTASYYTIRVNGRENRNAAWTYPNPKPAAGKVRGYGAFGGGVRSEPSEGDRGAVGAWVLQRVRGWFGK